MSSEPIAAADLREVLGADARGDDEILVVSPALHDSPLAFWVSDADDAIARARNTQEQSVRNLRAEGVDAAGDTGDSDPLTALQDALTGYDADRVVVFVHPEGERSYREGDWVQEARERFAIPVDCHEIGRTDGPDPDVPATQSALAPQDERVRPPAREPDRSSPHARVGGRDRDEAAGGRAPSGWSGGLRSVRLLLALVLSVIGIVFLIVTLSTGSYVWLVVTFVALLGSLAIVAAQVVRLTGQTERQSPETVARLEEEGISDPERDLNDRLADASEGERDEIDPETALDDGDQAAESRRQQREVTPSRYSEPIDRP